MDWRERNGVRWLEAKMHGAHAAFTTRLGGVSEPPFDSLNLGVLTDDDERAVRENRRRLAAALGIDPSQVPIGLQVHGGEVIRHERPQSPSPFAEPGSPLPEADGHVVTAPGLTPLVFVADCLPIALLGPRGLALLHCGWRPLAAGIIAKGSVMTGATEAAIGPGIGPCCYQVGEEVAEPFRARFGEDVMRGRNVDLAEAIERGLSAAGVESIERTGLCTSCEHELFFSHRRDQGRTGRQGVIAYIR